MKHSFILFLLLVSCTLCTAQVRYDGKLETGYLKFLNHNITFDAGENFKGYNLEKKQNGIDVNTTHGISFGNNKAFAGLGVGYANFEGVQGMAAYSEIEFLTNRSKISPLLGMKIGYNHIWNQYEGGSGTAMMDLGVGIHYKVADRMGLFLKTGLYFAQQSTLIPIRLGVRF